MVALRSYADRIRLLNSKIVELGAKAIFVTQPLANTYRDGDTLVFRGVIDYYWLWYLNSILIQTCEAISAICVDLASELRFKPGDFYDHVHNTPSGAHKISEYLFRKLHSII